MNLAIDPNVFRATVNQDKCGEACSQALKTLYDQKDRHKVIVSKELQNAYNKFIQDNIRGKSTSYLLRNSLAYAKHLLSTSSALKLVPIEISNTLPEKIKEILEPNGCGPADPIDHCLINLATIMCKARTIHDLGAGIVLLLACCSQTNSLKLYNKTICDTLKQEIAGLEIECTSSLNFARHHVDPSTLPNKKQHSLMLEHFCNTWIHQHYNVLIKGPCKIDNEEIDVLCCKVENGKIQVVYVGECKLRVEDETAILAKAKFGTQFSKKIEAVKKYCWNQDENDKPHIIGFVFGDHETLDDNAWQFLQEFGYNFVQVMMPPNWRERPDWVLTYSNFKVVSYPTPLDRS